VLDEDDDEDVRCVALGEDEPEDVACAVLDDKPQPATSGTAATRDPASMRYENSPMREDAAAPNKPS